jgi:hypothetical protein
MPGDAPHFNRVATATQRVLDLLASLEDDDALWPDRPDDDLEFLRKISLCNADTLGSVLASSFLGHLRTAGPELADEWLAEVMQIFVKAVNPEAPEAHFDWDRLKAMAEQAWDSSDAIPDHLPDDME